MTDLSAGLVAPRSQSSDRALGLAFVKDRSAVLLRWAVAFWIFCGGFVVIEPSPYEAAFLLVLPLVFVAGMGLHRSSLAVFGMMVSFVPFAIIAAFQVRFSTIDKALIYAAVTIYLWLTAYVVANFVAEAPQRHMRLIVGAYTLVACLVALIGILAYLGLMPARDLFLRYDRAKALFKDPNVFGPFLILPAMFAIQRVMLLKGLRSLVSGVIYLVLFLGVFVSFSRGAWGHMLASTLLTFAMVYFAEAKGRDRVRMLALMTLGSASLVLLLAVLLNIDSVRELFDLRFSLSQDYDTGSTGRFARQGYALDMALSHPWGIGPLEFSQSSRIIEEPHNVYVNVFLSYGWGGGLAFVAFMFATLWRGVSRVLLPSPNRLLLIPLVATYVPLMMESAIIDSDHWRHFYLVAGLIWGVTSVYRPEKQAPGVRSEPI